MRVIAFQMEFIRFGICVSFKFKDNFIRGRQLLQGKIIQQRAVIRRLLTCKGQRMRACGQSHQADRFFTSLPAGAVVQIDLTVNYSAVNFHF